MPARRFTWYRRLMAATALPAVTSLALMLAPAEATQANQGLQDGWAIGESGQINGGQLLSDEFGFMQQAGAGWVRVNFRLGQCFTDWASVGCNGLSALQTYDQVIANAQARNLKVLGLLSSESWHGQQSDWTANNAENVVGGNGLNPYIQSFAQRAAGVLASHFSASVTAWEIWNEPNAWSTNPSAGVYTGSSFMYPSNFAELLAQSHAAIKSGAPAAMALSGGLLGLDSGTTSKGSHNGYKGRGGGSKCPSSVPSGGDYLCSTYDAGRKYAGWRSGASPFEAVGQHLYVDQASTTSAAKLTSYLGDLRKVYVNYGNEPSSKQTQVTEFGWSSGSVSATVQAQNLQVAYQSFMPAKMAYVGRAYWYRTQDLGVTADYYGVVDTNGGTKPAYAAYQQYAAY